jgi:hypothetical protein
MSARIQTIPALEMVHRANNRIGDRTNGVPDTMQMLADVADSVMSIVARYMGEANPIVTNEQGEQVARLRQLLAA